MKNPLEALLQSSDVITTPFAHNSRYYGLKTTTFVTADNKEVAHLKRRFIPAAENFTLLHEHTVLQGDRLDNLASQYLGDPELYWQICDANTAMQPDELTETIGKKLRITLPKGIPG